jgi:hypothetical protein
MGFILVMTGSFTGLLQAESRFLVALLWTLVDNAILLVHLLAFSSRIGIRARTLGQMPCAILGFVPLVILLASKTYRFLKRFDVQHMDWSATLQPAALLMPAVLACSVAPPVSWSTVGLPHDCLTGPLRSYTPEVASRPSPSPYMPVLMLRRPSRPCHP